MSMHDNYIKYCEKCRLQRTCHPTPGLINYTVMYDCNAKKFDRRKAGKQ
jgi:hypothetical protein